MALCLTSLLSNMTTYNFTKICMTPENGFNASTDNTSDWLQACVAIGALAVSLPYTYLFQHYTKKWVFLSAGIISAGLPTSYLFMSTALVPLAHEYGFMYFLIARTFQGVAFSATFPIIGAVTADWAVLTEHGLFVGLLTGCTQLSNMFTMPVSGALCSTSWGWQSVYYVHAALSVFAFCCWVLIYKDRPDEHVLVSAEELSRLQQGKLSKVNYANNDIPFRAILSSKTLWGVWIAAFADLLAVQLVAMFNPQYLNDYLHYNVLKTDKFIRIFFVPELSPHILRCFDETCKLRVYNSLALGASAIFFAILAFIPRENRVIAIVVLVFAESLLGLNTAGFNKCATLHSRQYGHFVMTQIMNLWALTILLEPFVVHAIVAQNDWRNCFLCHSIALLICNAIFCIWADAKPAPWTNVDHRGERSKAQLLKDGAEEAAPSRD
ncbi:unnamed protein product [Angiostrongylus costaricensis]|uniref:MFS domain-containing protein n=1 Tax=Angiostrongylus costaricensis TaxID=334426 RepID=A0A0R3PPN5_ANGCS|nr:unnamed protein product [Angiostrongylus costaricensis]